MGNDLIKVSSVLVAMLFAAMSNGSADATLTESASAPVSFVLDQPLYGGSLDGSHDYSNNDGAPGQTFTTSDAFTLTGVTVLGGGSSGNGPGGLTIIISQVVDGTLSALDEEKGYLNIGNNNSDYLTLTLANPVSLAANTQYAYAIFGTDAGYVGFAKSTSDVLAGGYAMQSGSAYDDAFNGDTITNVQGDDRTFYLEGTAAPEPSAYAMLLGGLALLGFCVRGRAVLLD